MGLKASFEVAKNRWGIAKLREKGYDVPDDAEIEFEEATEGGGGCETCWYAETVVYVRWGAVARYTYYGYFTELLDELLEAGEESAND